MKCRMMRHFIRIYTVCLGKKDSQTKKSLKKEYNLIQWTIYSLLYITSRKNPLVYKGLVEIQLEFAENSRRQD